MAAITSIVAYAALAVAAVGAAASYNQSKQAQKAGKRAQQEQKAAAAQQAAAERRQQIREERVRRARILQAGELTGTAGSSGEIGAVAGMSTQLGSNIGFNLGQIASASRVGDLLQQQASYNTRAQGYSSVSSLAMSVAGGFGGAGGTTKAPAGTTPQPWNVDYQATRDR